MASARRIVFDLSTTVKQRIGVRQWSRREMGSGRRIDVPIAAGIPQWSRREMGSARRIDVSSAVKQWSRIYNKNRDLSTAIPRSIGTPEWPIRQIGFCENRFTRHSIGEVGYTVDVADLLLTPERDFLVKNNSQKIKVADLRGKTIVLFIVPLDLRRRDMDVTSSGVHWDMIDAYNELLCIGSAVEFVCVPVRLGSPAGSVDDRAESLFRDLFSTLPFPAIPFSDAQAPEGPVVQTFSLDDPCLGYDDMPYWVVIDPTNTVVATRYSYPDLFKLFGGTELHPLSQERIEDLEASHESESRLQLISKWDQLLASDTRDFLLSSNGDKVPISSLKGKLVGLYFCENIPHPPRMQAIKKVYEEAKSRGYDFEIVQITFHYHPFNAKHRGANPTVQQRCEDVSWLTLPFKDPSCRQVQRILHCVEEEDTPWVGDFDVNEHWVGDSLVLIHPDDHSRVHFELSGAEILERWGIGGHPFTRQCLYKAEYEVQKREVTLQRLLQTNQCLLRSVGDGFDLVDAVSQLSGKRVLVLFAPNAGGYFAFVDSFVSMLKSEYQAQLDNVEEEGKFEVMYVSTGGRVSSFKEFIKDMPWLVMPISTTLNLDLAFKVFKVDVNHACVAAFNEQGELIAKSHHLPEKKEGDKSQFPFIDQDLEECISEEVDAMCDVSNYRGR